MSDTDDGRVSAIQAPRYVARMSALRLACRTPWGELHDLVVARGHVLVPESLGHVPPLWWLGDEHHPRVAVTEVAVLKHEIGVALGPAPYCVPIERWNES